MPPDTSLKVAKRPEPHLERSWGVYSPRRDRWLDVVFRSKKEALETSKVLIPDRRDEGPR